MNKNLFALTTASLLLVALAGCESARTTPSDTAPRGEIRALEPPPAATTENQILAAAAAHPQLPVIGVIEPGAAAAVAATRTGRIAVLATEGTVRGGAYQRAIHALRDSAEVTAVPATLFVALSEEGWTDGEVALAITRRYLAPLFADADAVPDVLVLGCTHFPPLVGTIRAVVGQTMQIVDSAATTAAALVQLLAARGLNSTAGGGGGKRFLVTDGEERFARVGPVFLGAPIDAGAIERVDLLAG